MNTGVVKFFCIRKGFGFVTDEAGGADVFFHISTVHGDREPEKGDCVEYAIGRNRDGRPIAVNMKVL